MDTGPELAGVRSTNSRAQRTPLLSKVQYMPLVKLLNPCFNTNLTTGQPALNTQPNDAGYSMHPQQPADNRRGILVLGAVAVIMLFVAVAGHGMTAQPAQEVAWLERLAASGDAGAQLQLGLALRNGRYGLTPDAKTGLYWLTQAANNGLAYAADLVGTAYAEGQITAPDLSSAQHWWTIAAKGGNAHAAQRLGEQLAATDPAKATHWLEHAAAQGNTQAEQDLRNLYSQNAAPASDLRLGKNALEVVATQLDSPTLNTLASIWESLSLLTTSTQTSNALLHSAEASDPTAEFQLGMRYRDGAWSVNRDPAQSEYWLHRAAADGNHLAIQALTETHHS